MNKIIKKFKQLRKLKFGSKIIKCRLGAPDGLYVDFPQYQIDTDIPAGPLKGVVKTSGDGDIKMPLGHGMVIAVNEDTGETRGSEYGRYGSQNGHRGLARRVRVPNFVMADPGNPTQEELDAYAKKLVSAYPNSSGEARIVYVKGADENKMKELMNSAEKGNGFYTNTDYRILDHNCGTYGCDLLSKSTPWYLKWKFGPYSSGTSSMVRRTISGKTASYKE